MRGECNQDPGAIDAWVESLIVLAVLGVTNGRSKQRIYRSLRDIDPLRVDTAAASLTAAGVILRRGNRVLQSPGLERLDRLDMICI